MQTQDPTLAKSRVGFLLVLALGITLLFFWLIKGFLVTLLLAAVFAAIVRPFYGRLARLLGDRKAVASGLTVLLSLVLVIIPVLLFLGILVDQAVEISESAGEWVTSQVEDSEDLQKKIEEDPHLRRLVPYEGEIKAKAGQLASKAGSLVATLIAAGARGTAEFLLMLFVMLFAMFYFLTDGPAILDAVLRFTPLSADDKTRLLGTFSSVGSATLKGTAIIGIVQGGMAGLAYWVAGIEGALFWSAVTAVMSVVPTVGTALVWVPAVIFLALHGQIGAAVGVGLWCAVVVGSIDNVLRPLLVGKETEMPDLLVLLTTLGGLALFGAAGIVIGPIIGALYLTAWHLWGSAMDEAGGAEGATPAITNVEE